MKLELVLYILWLTFIQTAFCCIFINLDNGVIKGRIARNPTSSKVFYAFQEIPYAAPPIGNLRFQPPQRIEKWKGVLDTTKNTKICYQVTSDSNKENEDCLYLNVYTPELPSKNNHVSLPVMVFIHGGGYIIGDATHKSYGPEFLVNYDVVVVTLNYRLGVFGFLSTQDKILPGNNGLKDQLFALQWVNKNIHLFGGDSSRVTIMGQSAGASSVGYHLISKKSQGLYRAAIMESGSVLSPFGYQRNARYYGFKIGSYINSSLNQDSTSEELLNVMRAASVKDIDAASSRIAGEENYDTAQLFQGYYYAPVIEPESEEAFLSEKMFEIINRGGASRVPIIIGINSEESLSQTTDLQFLKGLMSRFDNDLKALVPNDMNVQLDVQRNEAGYHVRKIYSGDNLLQNVPAAGVRYMSDTTFTRSVIQHARTQSKYSPVYFYQFSYDGAIGNVSVVVEGADRVGHNEESAYLWRIQNDMFNNYDLSIYPENDLTTSARLLTMWTNFAKTLNPTPQKLDLLQNISWPTFTQVNFPYLNIDQNLEIRIYPKKESFEGWSRIYTNYGVRPFDTY